MKPIQSRSNLRDRFMTYPLQMIFTNQSAIAKTATGIVQTMAAIARKLPSLCMLPSNQLVPV